MVDTSFRVTLRQLAEAEDAQDRRRLYDMLASQIEVAFNNQANNTQVVLWDVQEAAYKKIDDLHAHQSDTNTLLSGVAESLAMIQGTVQQVLNAHKESAARLGKLEKKFDALDKRDLKQHEESAADRASLTERIERIEQILAARPAQREAEHRQLLEALQRERGDEQQH